MYKKRWLGLFVCMSELFSRECNDFPHSHANDAKNIAIANRIVRMQNNQWAEQRQQKYRKAKTAHKNPLNIKHYIALYEKFLQVETHTHTNKKTQTSREQQQQNIM